MVYPAAGVGPRSASGVRRGGDKYQDLVVWSAALQLIHSGSKYRQLEVERLGNGNFDDVALRSTKGPDRLGQVKWSTNAASFFDEAYLTAHRANGTSLLQKMYRSYAILGDGEPILEVTSNRVPDATHGLIGTIDGRTNLLVPAAADAAPGSVARKALETWAAHVGATPEDVLKMLTHLHFLLGRNYAAEVERATSWMLACGLRSDENGLDLGVAAVQEWITSGRRVIIPEDVHASIDKRGLRADAQRAVLLIQALEWDTHPDDADDHLDWVPLFAGDTPRTRTVPTSPGLWTQMQNELEAAVGRLEAQGHRALVLRGTMRQATFFLTGSATPKTRGWSIRYSQRPPGRPAILWDTDATRAPLAAPSVKADAIGAGSDLAVVVSTTTDASSEVGRYLRTAALPVSRLITITPATGANDQALASPAHGVTFSQQIVESVRNQLYDVPADGHVHLFLAGPGALAMMLGHRWNTVRATVVYEHLGAGLGYEPAFTVR